MRCPGLSRVGSLLAMALRAIGQRALRSTLVATTVAVGMATCTATVAFIEGVNRRFAGDLRKVGLDVLNVQTLPDLSSGFPVMGPVPPEAVEVLRRLVPEGEAAVSVSSLGPAEARALVEGEPPGPPELVTVVATDAAHGLIGLPVRPGGRFLEEEDLRSRRPVCVLDAYVAGTLFPAGEARGREVELAAGEAPLRLRVVGVTEEPFVLRDRFEAFDSMAGARMAKARRLEFKNVYLPRTILPSAGPEGAPPVDEVAIRVLVPEALARVKARVEAALVPFGPGVYVWSQREWVDLVLDRAGQFSMVGNIIWVVILGVAVVMVMTISLMAVRERHHEIGIRRAEGARRRDVVAQLAMESLILSVTGGSAGASAGVVFALALSRDTPLWERLIFWEPYVSWNVALLAVGLSVAVGLAATALPARRVVCLDVVEALRGG